MTWLRTVVDLRTDVQILLALTLSVLVQSVLFFLDVRCSGWPVWISFAGLSALMATLSPRRLVKFVLVTGALALLTAFTFSYSGCPDVMAYHFPMQDLLRNGWNPVRTATLDAFRPLLEGRNLGVIHTLFLPRFSALAGALTGASMNLYVGDAFLGYALLFAVFSSAAAFAARIMSAGKFISFLFAFCIAFTAATRFVLIGLVDYEVYAAMMIMLFGGLLYVRESRFEDLLLFILGTVILSLAKTTGMAVAALFCLALLFFRHDRSVLVAYGVMGALVIAIGFSPTITSWINYSCPLYPTVSWSAACPAIDITSDFSGNEDALRMGYAARACYAWVSPAVATRICSWAYGRPDFNPVFLVEGGVAGLGPRFGMALGLSLVALVFSKKNLVTLLCGFISLTTFVMPLKYVGFFRYVPQVYAIPVLAMFNFYLNPVWPFHKEGDLWRIVRIGLLLLFPVRAAFGCFRATATLWCQGMADERTRQSVLSEMKRQSSVWQVRSGTWSSYSLTRRMEAAGLEWRFQDGNDEQAMPTVPVVSRGDFKRAWPSLELSREKGVSQAAWPLPRPLCAVRHVSNAK